MASSPFYKPIAKLSLGLLESLGMGRCQICDSVVKIGNPEGAKRFSNVTRENLNKAVSDHKGFMFWNREVAERKFKVGIRRPKGGGTYERRFICRGCIDSVFGQVLPNSDV